MVEQYHFGGGEGEGVRKTREEVMSEIIAKSKMYKVLTWLDGWRVPIRIYRSRIYVHERTRVLSFAGATGGREGRTGQVD